MPTTVTVEEQDSCECGEEGDEAGGEQGSSRPGASLRGTMDAAATEDVGEVTVVSRAGGEADLDQEDGDGNGRAIAEPGASRLPGQ